MCYERVGDGGSGEPGGKGRKRQGREGRCGEGEEDLGKGMSERGWEMKGEWG